MWSDAIDLRDFYRTSLGQMARRVIRRRIREIWPNTTDMQILGLGYASPYLLPFRDASERVISTMPAGQGVLHWPTDGPNLVTLADEAELPFADTSFDRVLLVHAIESAEQLRPMLREIWRVMQDGGRLLIVVPNRRGIWARLDRTPFGNGRPYTLPQITRLVRDNLFTPVSTSHGLFMPPSRRRMLVSSAPAWENIGRRWFPHFGGVIFVEATKQIYAATPVSVRKRRGRRVYLPVSGATKRGQVDPSD
jgi:SAM-dependent methyltransferase